MRKLGFVFQTFNLLATFSAVENVELPMSIAGKLTQKEIRARAVKLLTMVGLEDRLDHIPSGTYTFFSYNICIDPLTRNVTLPSRTEWWGTTTRNYSSCTCKWPRDPTFGRTNRRLRYKKYTRNNGFTVDGQSNRKENSCDGNTQWWLGVLRWSDTIRFRWAICKASNKSTTGKLGLRQVCPAFEKKNARSLVMHYVIALESSSFQSSAICTAQKMWYDTSRGCKLNCQLV